ncbi:hypothetical protein [Agromyces aerolatus]|uniref:hypothetical protein n=1 Tax=Agromyces sp. LY-1074 TaxID=3074080 RepID=UPI002865526C|nr:MULTISPECIES: hypothetical protein [unclassified Agromyces]MDR5698820.1 hypothetical protein [Agromyces sp. LY-1074]MDR5705402.1 hypothetical protein [Agromyces sp. LY-1358]
MTDAADEHDDRPVRGARAQRMLRIVVLVALCALVLPLVLSLASVAHSSASRACAITVGRYDASATASRVTFDLFGPGGAGWLCFADRPGGEDRLLANLGMIPAVPREPLPAPDERNARAA